MAYQKQEWKNLPNKDTPVSAERLRYMEEGIYQNSLNNDYSENETIVGTFLGKPLYRRIFDIQLPQGSGWSNNLENMSYVKSLVKQYGNMNETRPIPFIEPDCQVFFDITDGNLRCYQASISTNGFYVNVILEYTKNTD